MKQMKLLILSLILSAGSLAFAQVGWETSDPNLNMPDGSYVNEQATPTQSASSGLPSTTADCNCNRSDVSMIPNSDPVSGSTGSTNPAKPVGATK